MKKCYISIEFWDKNHEYHYRSMWTSFRKALKLIKKSRKQAGGKEISICLREMD